MNEKPILFSGGMVRAILAGAKTQTRRVCKQQEALSRMYSPTFINGAIYNYSCEELIVRCPYPIGTRLWVRETWRPSNNASGVLYRATDTWADFTIAGRSLWHPSIFMPRQFSRVTIEVTDVRCQQVQEISEDDAVAEGVDYNSDAPADFTHRGSFAGLWDSINAKRKFGWFENPWVWAYTFRRLS